MRIDVNPGALERLGELLYYFPGEYLLLSLGRRDRPGAILGRVFKLPVWQYRLGLGGVIGGRILLLTTTGRKTGKLRSTPLGYMHDQAAGTYYVTAGWHGRTDWYRNLVACPRVGVQVGSRRFACTARQVPIEQCMELQRRYKRRNPFAERVWRLWTDVSFDGSDAGLRLVAERFPMVALREGNAA